MRCFKKGLPGTLLTGMLVMFVLAVSCSGASTTEQSTAPATTANAPTTSKTTSAPAVNTAVPSSTQTAALPPTTSATPKPSSDFAYIIDTDLLAMLNKALDTGIENYIAVDLRVLEDYNVAHVQQAINIPPDLYNTQAGKESIINDLKMLPANQLIIFYDDDEDAAPQMAQKLLDLNLGYKKDNIRILKGGMQKWMAEGLPTRSAEQ
jgi:rhodanese-related sulfurtransferase